MTSSDFSEYGFERTSTSNRNLVSIDVTYCDYETSQAVFAMAERAKASTIENLKAKIEQVSLLWERDRLAGIEARSEFNAHKESELGVLNHVQRARNAMNNAIAHRNNLKNTTLDTYASLQEREDHKRKIAEANAKAEKLEGDALSASGVHHGYVASAERLAERWNAAQRQFIERDGHLNMLRAQLAQIQGEDADVAAEEANTHGLII